MLPIENQESELMAEVPVNGKVLKWAREIRGLRLDEAAELLSVSSGELEAYESEEKRPLVGFLRTMSAKYRINFSSLLMPEPLPIKKLPTDYRKRFSKRRLSMDTIVAIEEVREALEVFKDISSTRKSPVHKAKLGRATLRDDPEELAAQERRKFGVSFDVQRSWKRLWKARIEWRKRIEGRGVFTYMIAMPAEELSGFSIFQDDLAAICVNDNESTEGAKIFTFFHEYCHLLLRKSGISDEKDGNSVERFCNKFAASFLIPRNQLQYAISAILGDITPPYEFSDADVKKLSGGFMVSNRAMAFRLEETSFAPKGFYGRRTAPWDVPSPPRPMTPDSQPDYIRIRYKRNGPLHTSTVLEAVKRNAINSFDASELIGIRPQYLHKFEALLG
jgi:Zn-dependent peptidase ImmA (M78 family)/transcriptional regulator with XRE-family HTH domain